MTGDYGDGGDEQSPRFGGPYGSGGGGSGGGGGGGNGDRVDFSRRVVGNLSHNVHLDVQSSPRVQAASDSGNDESALAETRRERNRIAARKSRQRKVHRVQQLEDEKNALERKHEALTQETMDLQRVLQETMMVGRPQVNEQECQDVHQARIRIIRDIEEAINTGTVREVLRHFHKDFVLYGPQSSVQLKGQDVLLSDYAITAYLYDNFSFKYTDITRDIPGSKHYRVYWEFSGEIKRAGASTCEEFVALIDERRGKRITFPGVSNISFSEDKIIYMHRSADQSKYLGLLV